MDGRKQESEEVRKGGKKGKRTCMLGKGWGRLGKEGNLGLRGKGGALCFGEAVEYA